jgi:hypothetical protein
MKPNFNKIITAFPVDDRIYGVFDDQHVRVYDFKNKTWVELEIKEEPQTT